MFTQPINQTGLAGFIPLRRQEGGVPNEALNIGQIAEFDIFGREIGKTTTDIGQLPSTSPDIGQLPSTSPDEFAPGLSSLNINRTSVGPSPETSSFFNGSSAQSFNFNDPTGIDGAPMFVGQTNPNTSQNMSDTLNTAYTGVDPSGLSGIVNSVQQAVSDNLTTNNIIAQVVSSIADTGITKALPGPVGSLLGGSVSTIVNSYMKDGEVNWSEVALDGLLGILPIAFPPLAIPILLFKLGRWAYNTFGGDSDSTNVTGNFGLNAANIGLEDAFDDPNTGSPSQSAIFGPTTDTTNIDNQGVELDIGAAEGFLGDISGGIGDPNAGDGDGFGGFGGGGDGAGGCWVAGTQVLMENNTYSNIEDLGIGDMVMSYPETKNTRRWNTPLEAKPIVSLLVGTVKIWHLNDSMVSGTEWMIKGDGTAAIVQWLNIGDTVLGPDNNLVEVTRVEPAVGQLETQVIYNFETKDNYSYIADGMRTIRGRAVRAAESGAWSEEYLSGDTNAYEGSMQDEYDKKFKKLAA